MSVTCNSHVAVRCVYVTPLEVTHYSAFVGFVARATVSFKRGVHACPGVGARNMWQ